ncbi:type IV toxin-antitoxin system AbiEi family antitoxin [Cellulomonas bogoriensis]|uniref:type IV toxin-antitoxin system AbiEi family antitoxin n=1 Tax=Cellulomonas bogoriensis TaxID=301388 RepID=UPI0018DD0777|nr:type IV toxin-antitoxin system AbiEi family antitoxin [Cellulomonas bogoriensis]
MSVLGQAAGATLTLRREQGGRLAVSYGTSTSILIPVWAGEGYPQDVRAALRRLPERGPRPGESPVIVASQMSPGGRSMLLAQSLSWADARGAAHVRAEPGLVVVVDGREVPQPQRRRLGVAWTPGAGAVAELLLARAQLERATSRGDMRLPTVTELADALHASPTVASTALRMFDAEGWTAKKGPQRGPAAVRFLTDPSAMLSSWVRWYRETPRDSVEAHALVRDGEVFLEREIARVWRHLWWAATGPVALERRAPFLTAIPVVDLYADLPSAEAEVDDLLQGAGLRRVERGARVRVHRADRYLRAVTPPTNDVVPIVSDVRLYGDLMRVGGREEEAADHLRETRIGF